MCVWCKCIFTKLPLCLQVLGEEEVAERDIVEACKLAESLVLNCIGKIDMVHP